jgi:hypothetical protein
LRKLAQTKTEYVFTQCSTPCHQYWPEFVPQIWIVVLHMSEHTWVLPGNRIGVGVTMWILGTIEAVDGNLLHLKVSQTPLCIFVLLEANIFALDQFNQIILGV